MSKRTRIKYAGAYYHVFNRGVKKGIIFREEGDYQFFIKGLMDYARHYLVDAYIFCLMPNHYHLVIKTNLNNLSSFMEVIDTKYAMYYNRKYNESGHVFQGRYKSILIEDETYLYTLLSYVLGNPIRAGLIKDIEKYSWSSFNYYYDKEESFIKKDFVLKKFPTKELLKKYIYTHYNDRLHIKKTSMGGYIGKKEKLEKAIYKSDRRHKQKEKVLIRKRKTDTIPYKLDEKTIISSILEYYGYKDLSEIVSPKIGSHKISKIKLTILYGLKKYCGYTYEQIASILNYKLSSMGNRYKAACNDESIIGLLEELITKKAKKQGPTS